MAGSVEVSIVYATDLADLGQRENIGNRVTIVPNAAQVRELSNHAGVLEPAVCEGTKDVGAASNVSKHVAIDKDRDCRL
jgi:hypothetical protein